MEISSTAWVYAAMCRKAVCVRKHCFTLSLFKFFTTCSNWSTHSFGDMKNTSVSEYGCKSFQLELGGGNGTLTLILLTWTICRAPTNASKLRTGFKSAFKGSRKEREVLKHINFCCRKPWSLRMPFLPVDGSEHYNYNLRTLSGRPERVRCLSYTFGQLLNTAPRLLLIFGFYLV